MKPGDKVICIADTFDYDDFPLYVKCILDSNPNLLIKKGETYTIERVGCSFDGIISVIVKEKPLLPYCSSFFDIDNNIDGRPNDLIDIPSNGNDKQEELSYNYYKNT